MRIALIADIHSNLQALQAVLEEIRKSEPDTMLCAGDIVGYGARPNECCDLVKKNVKLSIAGNHDIAALTRDTSFFNPHAAMAVSWTADNLGGAQGEFLASLKTTQMMRVGGYDLAIHHGSPTSIEEYVYEEDATGGLLRTASADILILGHTHVPFVKRFGSGIIVNPGSVGQPRDLDPRASYAILDLDKMDATVVRVKYSISDAQKDIEGTTLPKIEAARLSSGT